MAQSKKTIWPTKEQILAKYIFVRSTGKFYWREDNPYAHKKKGEEAGTFAQKDGKGYRHIRMLDGEIFLAHQLVWIIYEGYAPTEIDHKNGNKSDNRRCNLRNCLTSNLNAENVKSSRVNNKLKLLGVHRVSRTGKYKAQLRTLGERHSKEFVTAEEAHVWYLKKKRELHKACTI